LRVFSFYNVVWYITPQNLVKTKRMSYADSFPALNAARTAQNNPFTQVSSLASSSSSAPFGTKHDLSLAGQYGLMGLMGVIRMDDPDRGQLALGMDLTTLGLDLNSDESLHVKFAGPWEESQPLLFSLPSSYPKTSLPVKPEMFTTLSLDCLFAIFYSVIRDVLQLLAAQELCKRKWYYHIELKIWFSSQVKPGSSIMSIIFFDLGTWERKFYVGTRFQNGFSPEQGFLSEETIAQAVNQLKV
jgi:hypothetical protein